MFSYYFKLCLTVLLKKNVMYLIAIFIHDKNF